MLLAPGDSCSLALREAQFGPSVRIAGWKLAKSREQDCSGSEVESIDACLSYYNGVSRINHYMDTDISIYIEEGGKVSEATFL